ncbi:hypothetical protein C8R43DRAFT_1010335 [Mycena crocata]|nr:hypothetical protein C8R43DRAFT_1010335 [Mycena crocata]
MKSCLKGLSLPGSPVPGSSCRKSVAFDPEGSEEVHWADEWDRTPTEPARKLSYQEVLELKEIQQSLPHAPQPPDLRPGRQLLSTVPIGLLPLAAADATSPVSPPLSPNSPEAGQAYQTPFVMPPGRARPIPPPTRFASPALTHLRPLSPPAPRPKPTFSFLPLLSPSPPASPALNSPRISSGPNNQSAVYANNKSSSSAPAAASYFPPYPPARAADDGEPDRVVPAASRQGTRAVAIPRSAGSQPRTSPYGYEHAYRAAEAAAYSPPFGSSDYDYARDRREMLGDRDRGEMLTIAQRGAGANATAGSSATSATVEPKLRKKKKTFMLINDVEVEIEEDDDEDDSAVEVPAVGEKKVAEARTDSGAGKDDRADRPQMCALALATAKTPTTPTDAAKSLPSTSAVSDKPPISPTITAADKSPISSAEKPSLTVTPPPRQPQTSPRLAVRPLSPGVGTTPLSPVSPLNTNATASGNGSGGRLSPVQARASSRLVRA